MHRPVTVVLFSLLTLTACGAGVDDASTLDIPIHHEGLEVRAVAAAAEAEPAVGSPVTDFVTERNVATVVGQGFQGADGAVVRVVTGILGCGFLETGRGEGRLSGGTFTLAVHASEDGRGYGSESVFIFVDTDGDGVCDETKGEAVFDAHVQSATNPIVIEAAGLTSRQGWMCSLVNQPRP